MPSVVDDSAIGLPTVQQRLLWIVRHGQRVDNVDRRWRADGALPRGKWDDPPLSARGVLQASEVGTALAAEPIQWVFCSPFTRCVQTAQQIVRRVRRAQGVIPSVCIEPGLAESLNVCHSPPGFPSIDEILKSFPELCVDVAFRPFIAADQMPTDERTSFCCFRRVIATLRHILGTFPGNVLIVSHGSPIAACHFALSGELNYPGQCTISKYRIPGYSQTPNGHGHWTDRWKNGQMESNCTEQWKKAMPLPPMGRSVVIMPTTEQTKKQTEQTGTIVGTNEGEKKCWNSTKGRDGAGGTLLRLDEALRGMATASMLCTDLVAECVALADASHLLEHEGLHDALVLRCSAAAMEEERGKR